MGAPEFTNQRLGDGPFNPVLATPSGNDEGPGPIQHPQGVRRLDPDAAARPKGARFQAHHAQAVPRFEFRTRQPEELGHDTELEGAQAVVGEQGHGQGIAVHGRILLHIVFCANGRKREDSG